MPIIRDGGAGKLGHLFIGKKKGWRMGRGGATFIALKGDNYPIETRDQNSTALHEN